MEVRKDNLEIEGVDQGIYFVSMLMRHKKAVADANC